MEYRNITVKEKSVSSPACFSCSVIGFGGAAISGEGGGYGFGQMSEKEAHALIYHAYDLGVNLFDMAPAYGFGLCEKRVGRAFKGSRRESVYFVTKGGITWDHSKRINLTNKPEVIDKMVGQSLKDLQSDYIDLYMIHWPDPAVDIRFPLEVLARFKESGKIRSIGLGNTNILDLEKAKEIVKIDAIQNQLNIFYPEVVTELFPYLKEHEIAFMAWGTLDKGILTGRVNEKRQFQDPLDARSWAPWWKKEKKLRELKFKIVKQLEQKGPLLSLALSYNLQYPEVISTLCGGRTFAQWESLIHALKNPTPSETLIKVQEIAQQWFQPLKHL